jgi:starch synthase
VWLIDYAPLYDRPGLYSAPLGGDFGDNAMRFALLGKAALAIADAIDEWPDVVHAHDWQGGPALLYAEHPPEGRRAPRRVMTIHNLAFQGLFPPTVIDELGLPRDKFHHDGYEFWGKVGFLKAGITSAHAITTVSPRYAKEIQAEEAGAGLDGLLRALSHKLVGIQNGIDEAVWSPERDPYLEHPYSSETLWEKRRNKAALQRAVGLPQRTDVPLVGSVARITDQKGFDLVARVLPRLLRDGMQYVVLGRGDPALEHALRQLEANHRDQVRVHLGFDEALAHQIAAGVDLYLMPSRFEPCGLNQLYAQAYGTPPLVRATGGLDDSVVDFDGKSRSGTGFKFYAYTDVALEAALRRALRTFADGPAWEGLQRRAMAQDFSWRLPALRYEHLYRA